MDQDIAQYRISIRGKKWYWSIFTWFLDAALHNSWIIHKQASGSKLTKREFRRELVLSYLTRYKNPPKGPGRTSLSKNSTSDNRVSDDVRYDRMDHLVIAVPNNKRWRCAGEGCSSIIRTCCKKCKVGLCIPCFEIFHSVTF